MKKTYLMNDIDKDVLIDSFITEFPVLRARIDISQDEISEIVGLSRQTYSAIETRKRRMTWSNYMPLLFVFYFNPATRATVDGLFPDKLKKVMMINHRSEHN